MTTVRSFIARHWHYHLSILGLTATVAIFIAGLAAGHILAKGGFHWGRLPRPISISGGPPPPTYADLTPFINRIHNQGQSESCVGQTLSTIMEITFREKFGHKRAFSAGFIWNQVNGGQDQGVSYDAAFHVLQSTGDDTLADFPYDGSSGYWVQPTLAQLAHAAPYRISSWRSIDGWDRHTVEEEIAHGRPIAIAIPVTDALYNDWGSWQLISQQSGAFHFWHSMTIVGYGPHGVVLLNSWGPSFGYNGLVGLSWSFLASVDNAMVISNPYLPSHHWHFLPSSTLPTRSHPARRPLG